MLAKAPRAKYDVWLVNFGYTCASASTMEEAVRKARKTGFQCNIFRSNDPFKIVKTVCPINGVRSYG